MRRPVVAVMVSVMLAVLVGGCSLFGGGGNISDISSGAQIKGKVMWPTAAQLRGFKTASYAPVEGAVVSVEGETTQVLTDAEGNYVIQGLSPSTKYVVNAVPPEGCGLPPLSTRGTPSENPESTNVTVESTAAVQSLRSLAASDPVQEVSESDFGQLILAAQKSESVQAAVEAIAQGSSVSLETDDIINEIVDNFYVVYNPIDKPIKLTYSLEMSGDGGVASGTMVRETTGGASKTIHVQFPNAPNSDVSGVYEWTETAVAGPFSQSRKVWFKIQNGALSCYTEHEGTDADADHVFTLSSLMDQDLSLLEFVPIEIGTEQFVSLKLSAEGNYGEQMVLWFVPGIGVARIEYEYTDDTGNNKNIMVLQSYE